jgi:heme-degrading monooxygenase HmoA
MHIADTPRPPYYAVIFTSIRSDNDTNEYTAMAAAMLALAEEQPGFLGVETARQGVGITVSYWRDHESIQAWRQHLDHVAAQTLGRARWYETYRVRIARVERDYGMVKETSGETR